MAFPGTSIDRRWLKKKQKKKREKKLKWGGWEVFEIKLN